MFEEMNQAVVDPQANDTDLAAVALPESLKDFDPANATPEQVAELVKVTRTALFQKNHWRGKAAEKKEIIQAPVQKPVADDDTKTTLDRLVQSDEKRTFGYQHKLSPEETDKLFAFAAGAKQSPAEALKDTFFQNALKSHRAQVNNDAAIPGPSNRRPTVEGKQWSELDKKDQRQNFGAFLGAVTGKGNK